METVKTAVIVLLLMAVLYGVYVVLNQPEVQPPSSEIAWHQQQSSEPLQIDLGGTTTEPSLPSAAGASTPPGNAEIAAPTMPELPVAEASPPAAPTLLTPSVPSPPPFAAEGQAAPPADADSSVTAV